LPGAIHCRARRVPEVRHPKQQAIRHGPRPLRHPRRSSVAGSPLPSRKRRRTTQWCGHLETTQAERLDYPRDYRGRRAPDADGLPARDRPRHPGPLRRCARWNVDANVSSVAPILGPCVPTGISACWTPEIVDGRPATCDCKRMSCGSRTNGQSPIAGFFVEVFECRRLGSYRENTSWSAEAIRNSDCSETQPHAL